MLLSVFTSVHYSVCVFVGQLLPEPESEFICPSHQYLVVVAFRHCVNNLLLNYLCVGDVIS